MKSPIGLRQWIGLGATLLWASWPGRAEAHDPALSLSPASGPAGTSVAVSVTGFDPDRDAGVFWDYDEIGALHIGPDGSGGMVFRVPGDAAPGSHAVSVLRMTCQLPLGERASARFEVAVPAPTVTAINSTPTDSIPPFTPTDFNPTPTDSVPPLTPTDSNPTPTDSIPPFTPTDFNPTPTATIDHLTPTPAPTVTPPATSTTVPTPTCEQVGNCTATPIPTAIPPASSTPTFIAIPFTVTPSTTPTLVRATPSPFPSATPSATVTIGPTAAHTSIPVVSSAPSLTLSTPAITLIPEPTPSITPTASSTFTPAPTSASAPTLGELVFAGLMVLLGSFVILMGGLLSGWIRWPFGRGR